MPLLGGQAGDLLARPSGIHRTEGRSSREGTPLATESSRLDRGLFRYAVESATEKGSARGCLMMCVAPIVNDAEVQRFLQSAVAGGAALVERRFRDGISAGDIPPDFPVAVRAIQVTAILLVA